MSFLSCAASNRGKSLLLILAFGAALTGCRQKEENVEVVPLEGKVERISVHPDGTGVITVLYFSEKQGQDVVGSGQVTRETEIMINGALASLKDIREGERVRGEVRIEKKGQERRQIALKIVVDRAELSGG